MLAPIIYGFHVSMPQDFNGVSPKIDASCFIASGSVVIGDVEIGRESSVWFQSVIRGDVNSIRIGKKTNIQDLSMIHVTSHDSPKPAPTIIGDEVTVGHRVILHGCTVNSRALIGMGSIILDGVVIGENCIIGAGSLVKQGMEIPSGYMVFGSPAKIVRPLTFEEIAWLPVSAEHYYQLSRKYL